MYILYYIYIILYILYILQNILCTVYIMCIYTGYPIQPDFYGTYTRLLNHELWLFLVAGHHHWMCRLAMNNHQNLG